MVLQIFYSFLSKMYNLLHLQVTKKKNMIKICLMKLIKHNHAFSGCSNVYAFRNDTSSSKKKKKKWCTCLLRGIADARSFASFE